MAGGGEEARCDYWEGRWVAPIVLAFLLLAVRLALPKNAAKEVAYSDLLTGLRAGDVTAVAFEEDSRRIYFHRATDDVCVGGGGAARTPTPARASPAEAPRRRGGCATQGGCRTTRGSC
ncbi:hypothetical protein OsI_05856 [Oryza sativa Indica Group]|uniref:Peptidase M41 FtsH extracellular domain-containing protein n=1 Tax=Oryza sativa subsp. indica TaxID=39946 RepID=B8AHS0_ORYSI|nr:hypothetical protein OsI_05856 [Oryza sativa Indica Group]